MTLDLEEELQGTGETATAVHPGGDLDTDMVAERCVVPGDGCTPNLSPEDGAMFVVNAARSPSSGVYFNTSVIGEINPQALDTSARRRFLDLSMQLIGLD